MAACEVNNKHLHHLYHLTLHNPVISYLPSLSRCHLLGYMTASLMVSSEYISKYWPTSWEQCYLWMKIRVFKTNSNLQKGPVLWKKKRKNTATQQDKYEKQRGKCNVTKVVKVEQWGKWEMYLGTTLKWSVSWIFIFGCCFVVTKLYFSSIWF